MYLLVAAPVQYSSVKRHTLTVHAAWLMRVVEKQQLLVLAFFII
jgi:hypothetical protein